MLDKKAAVLDIANKFGFPAVVCGWLLYERWTTMAQLTTAINENSEVVRQLMTIIAKIS